VVGVDTEQYDSANPEKYLKALLWDETNPVAQRAFRSYLGVMASPPVGFETFSEQVNHYMELPPFNFPNPLTYVGAYKTVSGALQALGDNVGPEIRPHNGPLTFAAFSKF
jgi:atrial natriuretic peptide receptor A